MTHWREGMEKGYIETKDGETVDVEKQLQKANKNAKSRAAKALKKLTKNAESEKKKKFVIKQIKKKWQKQQDDASDATTSSDSEREEEERPPKRTAVKFAGATRVQFRGRSAEAPVDIQRVWKTSLGDKQELHTSKKLAGMINEFPELKVRVEPWKMAAKKKKTPKAKEAAGKEESQRSSKRQKQAKAVGNATIYDVLKEVDTGEEWNYSEVDSEEDTS